MTSIDSRADLLASFVEQQAGVPFDDVDWRELLRLRERTVAALDAEITRRQLADRGGLTANREDQP